MCVRPTASALSGILPAAIEWFTPLAPLKVAKTILDEGISKMITATESKSYPTSVKPVGLSSLLHAAYESFAKWRRRRTAVQELKNLDDRMLKDIGLTRSEIFAAVYGIDYRIGRQGSEVIHATAANQSLASRNFCPDGKVKS